MATLLATQVGGPGVKWGLIGGGALLAGVVGGVIAYFAEERVNTFIATYPFVIPLMSGLSVSAVVGLVLSRFA